MQNLLITIAYEGTPYHGWAIQNDVVTVEGKLREAIRSLFNLSPEDPLEFQGASRTDAGVHAMGQCANLICDESRTLSQVERGLNALTPDDILIVSVRPVHKEFNARHDAEGKHYRYRIWNDTYPHPLLLDRTWHVPYSLDVAAIQDAAEHLVGTYDFASFRAADCQAKSTIREITSIEVFKIGKELTIDVQGTAFLKNMVRIIVGTLIEVGRGKKSVEEMSEIRDACDRKMAGPTAPPQGLMLLSIDYPPPPKQCPSGGTCTSKGTCSHGAHGAGGCHSHDHDHEHEDEHENESESGSDHSHDRE